MLGNEQQSMSIHHEYSKLDRIGKYLIHGFVFSTMMLVADIVLAIMLPMFIIFALFLGVLIWFALAFLIWGWVNGMLCSWLWDFEVRQHWKSLIGHGFVLLIVNLPATALLQFLTTGIYPGIYISIRLAFLSIFDGIFGKAIGGMFKESDILLRGYKAPSRSVASRRTHIKPPQPCPFCGAVFPYRYQDLSPEGTAPCRRCGAIIHDPKYVTEGSKRPHSTPQV
jgi:hypothetical protein